MLSSFFSSQPKVDAVQCFLSALQEVRGVCAMFWELCWDSWWCQLSDPCSISHQFWRGFIQFPPNSILGGQLWTFPASDTLQRSFCSQGRSEGRKCTLGDRSWFFWLCSQCALETFVVWKLCIECHTVRYSWCFPLKEEKKGKGTCRTGSGRLI